ncbi:MAG: glycosyltransferase family 1 protein, partial [Segetibacter sp.]
PYTLNRGQELKRILVRAAVASCEVLLNELSNVRLISPEPVIHIAGNPNIENDDVEAAAYTNAMFQAWDMLSGRLAPELRGRPEYLDIVGGNFYQRNQWIHNTTTPLSREDARYRHFSDMLKEIWLRYQRPLFVSETGTEDDGRADWFNYICDQTAIALDHGVPVHGICLYPILNHPGWADNRHCHNGLFDYPDASGNRQAYQPLAEAIHKQRFRFDAQAKEMILNTRDVICFSHLRWGFVFQRPQHLMSRFARAGRVFYWEEPVFEDAEAHLRKSVCPGTGVNVVTPVLPCGLDRSRTVELQRRLLSNLLEQEQLANYAAWYYTPMASEFTTDLKPTITVYDCMDELSAFAGAPLEMRENEQALFRKADLIFTGGASLFKSKQRKHDSVHLFPSSIDFAHFAQARSAKTEPADQGAIPHPRLGYSGVIDERMDLDLIRQLSEARPDWQFVMLGPVVKINADLLPQAKNIHYLGMKQYIDLPRYLSGWDVALLPFARNESTKFISPTKTPEYLAAGLPVVSSPIQDVVQPYGKRGFVQIAEGAQEFIERIEGLLRAAPSAEHLRHIDEFLMRSSWDQTWSEMNRLIEISERSFMAVCSTPIEAIDKGSVYV